MIELRYSDLSSLLQVSWKPGIPDVTDKVLTYCMGLFSFAGKTKQETVSNDSEFYSHAEEESNTSRRRSKRKQNQENNDPVLPEKKRARRRLVGAVALVLAAIIGLPMILDSEPKPLTRDIAIEIPSKDKPQVQAPAKAPVSALPNTLPPNAALDKGEEIIDPDKESSPAPKNQQQANLSPTIQPELKQEPKPELKAVPKKVEKSADEDRARALLEGLPEQKADKVKFASDGKSGKFVIQVAALGSQDKVNELQNKLKGAGIKSYTSKVATQSGERIRVRVGPFSSKEEAEKVRAKLVKIGLGGTLVPA
jgi:DedD protein